MEAYLYELIHLILRYFHVIAGIAWIGASFYFAWLDNNLEAPPQWKRDKGIKGDLWAIHGGGFYEVAKYQVGPEKMPSTLHWFKWEAYTTWLTGILLFTLLYYVGADAYLLDTNKSNLDVGTAIASSMTSIAIGYAVYRFLCTTKLADNGRLFIAACIVLIGLYSWGLDQLFADRAVYIHVGALIGTCMAGNVYHVIMPSQRYMVAEVEAGRIPDSAPGLKAKLCSIHNNYATLPIIFIMLSNHFAFTYTHQYGWLVLVALFAIGMWVRHYFNLKHIGINKPSVLISGIGAFLVVMLTIAPWSTSTEHTKQSQVATVSDAQAWNIIISHCASCHSETPTSTMFTIAPLGLMLDNIEQVKQHTDKIYARAVINKDMPLGNLSQMTEEQRVTLGTWLHQMKEEE